MLRPYMYFPPGNRRPRLRSLVKQGSLAVLVAAATAVAPLAAQMRASLGIGVGTVRTEGGTSFSSASLSPVVRYTTPDYVVQGSGFVASLPAGAWAAHGRLYFWGTTPPVVDRWRLGVEGIYTGTTFSDGSWTAAVHGLGELLWSSPRWGVGLGAGPSTGWIANDIAPRFVALHTRGRAWWRPGGRTSGTEWDFAVEPTHFIGAWFTDLSAGFTIERGQALLSLTSEARLSSVYGSTGAGSAFLQVWVSPTVSLEVGGGSYLREPYEGFPRGGFATLGVRIGATRPAARGGSARQWAALTPERRGDSVVVQFRFPGVSSAAIAGDWNGWTTVPLRSLGGDLWEGTLALGRGVYHFNILVDGHDWVVPNGVATVPDGLGGMVAVLLVR